MSSDHQHSGGRFATTQWSLVLAAGRDSSPDSGRALAWLCRQYWYPVYLYVRRQGQQPDEAGDLTQDFFAWLLEHDTLLVADPQRGRFRSFLITSLKHFLANHWRAERAQKRGGHLQQLSLDVEEGERRYQLEPVEHLTAERAFERRWALTLLETVLQQLRQAMEESGKLEFFEAIQPHLYGDDDRTPYAVLAERLDKRENALKVAVHRVRQQFKDLLRAEIGATVSSDEEVDDELSQLMRALAPV